MTHAPGTDAEPTSPDTDRAKHLPGARPAHAQPLQADGRAPADLLADPGDLSGPAGPQRRPMGRFYRFASRGVIIPFLRAVSRQHVEGLENLPRRGGYIVVANHLSDIDSLTAMRSFVDAGVPVYSLAKSTIFDIPVLGRVFKAGGQIPVYRGTEHAGSALVEAERRLAAGDVIMIFPEGTLSRDPLLWPMTGKTGAARLAMATGAPIVPLGQWGAHEILDSFEGGGFHPFPRHDVRIRIGRPFTLEQFGSDLEDRVAVRQATAFIMRQITDLVEELRGQKAPRPYDMRYDGDPGKTKHGIDRRGVRRPDPVPAPGSLPASSDDAAASAAPQVTDPGESSAS